MKRIFGVWLATLVVGLSVPASALATLTVTGAVSNSTTLAGSLAVGVSPTGTDAWATAYWPGLLTGVDFSTPSAPGVVGFTPSSQATALENGTNLAFASDTSGHVYAFVVSKNRNASATLNDDGSGNSLTIVNVTTPSAPVVVGTVHDLSRLFGSYGVALAGTPGTAGSYAYVAYQGIGFGPNTPATTTGGFSVIDLSNLSSPTVVANIDNGSLPSPFTGSNALQHATSVAISGHYAYVTAFYNASVTVISIATPTSPTVVATVKAGNSLANPEDLAVQGSYLYVANQSTATPELAVMSLAAPTNPTVVGTLSSPNLAGAYRIRVRGNFAYIAASGASAVAAVDISNPSQPRLADFVQDAAHLYAVTGLDLDSTGQYVVASSPRMPGQSTGGPPYTATTGTISVINLIPSPISVTITSPPPNPSGQASGSIGFSVNDGVSTLQCQIDTSPAGPCTTGTSDNYTGLGAGSHSFTVTATDALGHTSTANVVWTVSVVPGIITPPVICSPATTCPLSGAPQVGQTLTEAQDTWSNCQNGSCSFTYQWQDCDGAGNNCANIGSGTAQTYVLAPGDAGHTIRVTVMAKNGNGSGSATSTPTAAAVAPPIATTLPVITGVAQDSRSLSVSKGTWSGNPTRYSPQWERCDAAGNNCTPIAGATHGTYRATGADVGSRLDAVVTATNALGLTGTATAAPTAVVRVSPPLNGKSPQISGAPEVGASLRATPGSWTGQPPISFTYAWWYCKKFCLPIAGATGSTYKVTSAALGTLIQVVVTGSGPTGHSQASSAKVGPVFTAQMLKAALYAVVFPRGKHVTIGSVLKHGQSFTFAAPIGGKLTLDWYYLPKGASLTKPKRHAPRPVLVAQVTVTFPAPTHGTRIQIKLTKLGRTYLKRSRQLKLTTKAGFLPTGGTWFYRLWTFTLK